MVHFRSTLRIHTCGNRRLRFSLSLTTNILRYSQHKVVWQLLLKVVAERSALICNKAPTVRIKWTVVQVTHDRGYGHLAVFVARNVPFAGAFAVVKRQSELKISEANAGTTPAKCTACPDSSGSASQ